MAAMNKYMIYSMVIFHFLSMGSSLAVGEEKYPNVGLFKNTKENSALEVSCDTPKNGGMNCRFVQMSVRKEAKPSELEKEIGKALEQYRDKTPDANECKQLTTVANIFKVLKTGQTPDPKTIPGMSNPDMFLSKVKKLSPAEIDDNATLMEAVRKMTCNPSKENLSEAITLSHEKKTRTCRVSVNPYNQSFSKDYNTGLWVSKAGPNGTCGVILISTFELDPDASDGFDFWLYKTRKVITKKSAKLLGLASCSKLDEEEYTYSWKASGEIYLGCDYIKFSAL